MSGQSLTSLKKLPPDLPQLPSQELKKESFQKEEIELGEVRREIDILIRERDGLKDEAGKLNKAIQFTKDQLKSDTEVKKLTLEKNALLSQIKKLASAIFKTKGYQDKLTKGLEEYGIDHIYFLNSLSQALQLDIRSSTENLTKKYAELTTSEDFLQGLYVYLEEYAQICEAETSQNALERTQIEEMGKEAVLAKNEASETLEQARSELSEADVKLKQAKERHEKADLFASKLEKGFDDEINRLNERENKIDMAYKLVQARDKDLERQKTLFLLERRKFISEQHRVRAIIKAWR